jgi:Fe-S-cluster containining protein
MLINKQSSIIMTEDKIQIMTPEKAGKKECTVQYKDDAFLREAVRRLVNVLVDKHKGELFPDICTCCGRCCKDRPVPVTAREIRKISFFLNMPVEEAFRKKYISPALTWNESDGSLKKVGNRCIFLERGTALPYKCRIHPIRPVACASLAPSMVTCEKDHGKLIYHLDRVLIEGDMLRASTRSRLTMEKSLKGSLLMPEIEGLMSLIARRHDDSLDSSDTIISEADACLGDLRRMYFYGGERQDFIDKVRETRDLTNTIDADSKEGRMALRRLSVEVDKLMDLAEGEPHPSYVETSKVFNGRKPAGPGKKDAPVIAALRFEAGTLFIAGTRGERIFHYHLNFEHHRSILPLVRDLVRMIVRVDNDVVAASLEHGDPMCFMCGECCRCYKVELTHYDIDRLADHFKMSEKEIVKKYLQPSLYTWNDSYGILRKKQKSGSSVKSGFSGCVFLEKKALGIYACGIYEARPEICRVFSARSEKCREMSRLMKWDNHVENLLYFDVINDEILLTTRLIRENKLRPVAIDLLEEKRLRDLCLQIKSEVTKKIPR